MFDIPRWAENTSHTMWLCGQSKSIHTLWHEAGCIAMRYMPLQWLTMRSCEQKCNKIVGCANVTTAVIVWTSATCQDTTPHLVYSGSTPQGGAGQSCNSSLATAISIPQQSFSIHHSWAITLLQQQSVQSRQPNQTVYKGFKSWTQLLMFAPVSFVACHNSYLAFHKAQSKWITQLESPERAERCMLRSDVLGNLAVVSPWHTKRCNSSGLITLKIGDTV